MAIKYFDSIRSVVRQILQDEFEEGENQVWPDEELDNYIREVLVQISERSAYDVKETLTTTASSRESTKLSQLLSIWLDANDGHRCFA